MFVISLLHSVLCCFQRVIAKFVGLLRVSKGEENVFIVLAIILILPFGFKWCQHSFHLTINLDYYT